MKFSNKKKDEEQEPKRKTLYTIKLTEDQSAKLKKVLKAHDYERYEVQYAQFAFRGNKVNVVVYESGKCVIQGKNTEDFITFILEGEVTGEAKFGYDEVLHPQWFELHAGMDESGKGDFFGPIIACCVIADGDMVRGWREAGIQDSKKITDGNIKKLEKIIKNTKGVVVKYAYCSMDRYNELMSKPRANVNSLLAWLHAKALTAALEEKNVPWGLLDKFCERSVVEKYFKRDDFDLRMETKAESDPVVAAASVCARGEFLRQMESLSKIADEQLLKGASASVKEQGKRIVEKLGSHRLGEFAKLHFKTAYEVLGLPFDEEQYEAKKANFQAKRAREKAKRKESGKE